MGSLSIGSTKIRKEVFYTMKVKAVNTHYRDILKRTTLDTEVTSEVADVIIKCFLYELAESLAAMHTVELPYVGDISLRTKSYDPNRIVTGLKKSGGSHVSKFRARRKDVITRYTEERFRGRKGESGSPVDSGVPENREDDQHQGETVQKD